MKLRVWGIAALAVACSTASAQAQTSATQRWMPNPEDGQWIYGWYDNTYSNKVTLERYSVAQRTNNTVRLQWTTDDVGNEEGTVSSSGLVDYRYEDSGVVNTNWSSTPPPPQFPVLCANAGPECGNSMAGSHYHLIWGSRSPVLQEPLLKGSNWASRGGQGSDVASVNRYIGTERVVVPAFPLGIVAAKVESDISQVGSLGDTYGTGLRTVWWVFGVGPVKVSFRHAGGEYSEVQLHSTNLQPLERPSDRAAFPLTRGHTMRFKYTNSRWMRKASRQTATVAEVANGTARIDVADVNGPIRVRGSYFMSGGRAGLTTLSVATKAATNVKFPKLGKGRRFFTPIDLMAFGYNPILTAYPIKNQAWKAPKFGRDRRNYGVDGASKVIGYQRVKTPAGRYTALLVESKLTQKGYPFGSGRRRMWFAPGVGLVKLEFRHRDGSVSRVERLPR